MLVPWRVAFAGSRLSSWEAHASSGTRCGIRNPQISPQPPLTALGASGPVGVSAGLKPTLVIRFHSVNFYLNPIPANKEAPGNALECQPSGARESVSRTFRPTVLFAHMLLSIRLGLGSALAATRAACQEGRSPRFKGLSRHCQEPIPGPAGFGCILGRISRRCSSITPTGQSKENNRNCPLGHLDHLQKRNLRSSRGPH